MKIAIIITVIILVTYAAALLCKYFKNPKGTITWKEFVVHCIICIVLVSWVTLLIINIFKIYGNIWEL